MQGNRKMMSLVKGQLISNTQFLVFCLSSQSKYRKVPKASSDASVQVAMNSHFWDSD